MHNNRLKRLKTTQKSVVNLFFNKHSHDIMLLRLERRNNDEKEILFTKNKTPELAGKGVQSSRRKRL